jgi:hypothetical protein
MERHLLAAAIKYHHVNPSSSTVFKVNCWLPRKHGNYPIFSNSLIYCAGSFLLPFFVVLVPPRSAGHTPWKSFKKLHYGAFTPVFLSVAITHQIWPAIIFFCTTLRMDHLKKNVQGVRKVGPPVEFYVSVPGKQNWKNQDKTNITLKMLVSTRSVTLVHILLCLWGGTWPAIFFVNPVFFPGLTKLKFTVVVHSILYLTHTQGHYRGYTCKFSRTYTGTWVRPAERGKWRKHRNVIAQEKKKKKLNQVAPLKISLKNADSSKKSHA